MTVIKNAKILLYVQDEGFESLMIKVAEYAGAYYYGFNYTHKQIGCSCVNPNTGGKPFATEHAAFWAAIKNIEAHFDKGFCLKVAYQKYNELTQLVIA